MEILHTPAPALYLCAAALTVWGGVSRQDRGRVTLGLLLLAALFPGRAEP